MHICHYVHLNPPLNCYARYRCKLFLITRKCRFYYIISLFLFTFHHLLATCTWCSIVSPPRIRFLWFFSHITREVQSIQACNSNCRWDLIRHLGLNGHLSMINRMYLLQFCQMRNTRLATNSKHEPLKGGSALFLHVYATMYRQTIPKRMHYFEYVIWDLEWV